MFAGSYIDWERGGQHVAWVDAGISGCKYPGREWSKVWSHATAFADAVVDDFGNLVIVGGWR